MFLLSMDPCQIAGTHQSNRVPQLLLEPKRKWPGDSRCQVDQLSEKNTSPSLAIDFDADTTKHMASAALPCPFDPTASLQKQSTSDYDFPLGEGYSRYWPVVGDGHGRHLEDRPCAGSHDSRHLDDPPRCDETTKLQATSVAGLVFDCYTDQRQNANRHAPFTNRVPKRRLMSAISCPRLNKYVSVTGGYASPPTRGLR